MGLDILYSNPYIQLIEKQDGFYIESFKKGYGLDEFNEVLKKFPQVKITSFLTIRMSILNAPKPLTKFGKKRSPIEIEVNDTALKAYFTIYMSEEEIKKDPAKIRQELISALQENKICFGILQDVLSSELKPRIKTLIAEGIAPEDGEPAKVKMYEIQEPKPILTEDGSVNHYELNLINKVNKGDWLGEKVPPTKGTSGKSVFGKELPARPGKDIPLKYDKKSVEEVYDEAAGMYILYAGKTGAVLYDKETIYVYDYLEIKGNVNYETGNIDFDGFVNIKGSIEDNFAVEAKKDIEVLGEFGIGGVEKVESSDGCIYIRGGVAGRNKTVIRCKKDLYTKFAADCTIECEGTVHIGFYCYNSTIKAKQVILESMNSRIIGGRIDAEIKVVASEVGNRSETPTYISVKGFDREAYKERFDEIKTEIDQLNQKLILIRQKVSAYAGRTTLTSEQQMDYKNITDAFEIIRDQLKFLQEERKRYTSYLRTKGEGEISINRCVHGNTTLQIKSMLKRFAKEINAPTTYYAIGKELKSE